MNAEQQTGHETDQENRSLKWRFWTFLQKWWVQAGFVAVVVILSYYLSRDGRVLATYIRITPEGATQFLSGVSQALAALLALSLAFLVFEMEGLQRERDSTFETFRSQMYKLIELTSSREPGTMNEFDSAIVGV